MSKLEKKWKRVWLNKKTTKKKLSLEDLIKLNGFSEHASITKYRYKKFVLKLVRKLEINKLSNIFEFGCGVGLNLFLLKKFCKSVSGYDYSDNLIKTAQLILKNKKNISSKKNFFSKKKIFDISIINSVFQYVSQNNIESVLNKLVNITKDKIYVGDIYDGDNRRNFIKKKNLFTKLQSIKKNMLILIILLSKKILL
jgi:SAM-dependent methyltransferase